ATDTTTGTLAGTSDFIVGDDQTPGTNNLVGELDELFVTAAVPTAGQIKAMADTGRAALQNHSANRVIGVTGADTYQQLHGAGAAAATVDRVTAVAVDGPGRYLYVGTNDNTTNTGGVTVI